MGGAPLDLAVCVGGDRVQGARPLPSVETVHGMSLLWLVAQEGAENIPRAPVQRASTRFQLLLQLIKDRPREARTPSCGRGLALLFQGFESFLWT